ncbi:MAG: hypothetical protein PHW76_10250, partial [Alphaproteobacteria bacterium]|nr:hypothetical protein [Alphaproteobacteria bacterium]
MYLVVFVSIAIALMGAYAQLYVKQSTDSHTQAAPMVTSLLEWHSTGWGLASYLLNPDSITEGGNCLMSEASTGVGRPTSILSCEDKVGDSITIGAAHSGIKCRGGSDASPAPLPC